VYACSKVGWFAHPVPWHGKKSGYATAKEGYWTTDRFIGQMRKAVKIAEFK